MTSPALDALRGLSRRLLERAYVPFSSAPTAAVLLLDDGAWIPGVRLESASFSLTIPALLNAYTTAVTCGRADDVLAFVLSRPMQRGEDAYVGDLPGGPWQAVAPDAWVRAADAPSKDGSPPTARLPEPAADPLDPLLRQSVDDEAAGIALARDVAERAYVPASAYPVGAVLETTDRRLVPGVNVEHPDWARILCAERNAVGTAYAYDLPAVQRLFLTCNKDPDGTPCGACRQVLAELTPDATLWMDRHGDAPEHARLPDLLPGSFQGRALLS